VYLHDRVIILGFPAAGVEHIFRNPRLEVKRFLDSKHKGRFKLFNFCVEPGRYYDPEIFENRVCRFPYRDHNVPHLQVLDRFLKTAKSWLDEDAENVVALHCKAGKGRAGMMSCALLLHMGYCVDAKNAIAHYDKLRVWKEKALTVPSQIRYVSYAEKISNNIRVDKNFSYKDTAGVIRKILFRNNRNCKLGVVLEVQKNCIGNKEQVWESPTCSQEFDLSCKVCGNVRLAIMTESGKLVGSLWFNVSFFDAEKIVFRKKEFDKLYKRDRHHKLFPEDFFVEVYADVSGVMMANPLRKKKLDSHVVEEIVV
jgi:phosphatidylinositol-3,4,5-trisphosphate 3-phosphatase/dual-specificity protein phosphatase PTEN